LKTFKKYTSISESSNDVKNISNEIDEFIENYLIDYDKIDVIKAFDFQIKILKKELMRNKSTKKSVNINVKLVNKYIKDLKLAKFSEQFFLKVFNQIKNDKTLTTIDLLEISYKYGQGVATSRSSKRSLYKSISTGFYARVYDRDATDMAKRATPW